MPLGGYRGAGKRHTAWHTGPVVLQVWLVLADGHGIRDQRHLCARTAQQ